MSVRANDASASCSLIAAKGRIGIGVQQANHGAADAGFALRPREQMPDEGRGRAFVPGLGVFERHKKLRQRLALLVIEILQSAERRHHRLLALRVAILRPLDLLARFPRPRSSSFSAAVRSALSALWSARCDSSACTRFTSKPAAVIVTCTGRDSARFPFKSTASKFHRHEISRLHALLEEVPAPLDVRLRARILQQRRFLPSAVVDLHELRNLRQGEVVRGLAFHLHDFIRGQNQILLRQFQFHLRHEIGFRAQFKLRG